jgi:hypothetical protein
LSKIILKTTAMKDNIFLLTLVLCLPLSVYSQGSKKFAAPQFALPYEGKSINIIEEVLLLRTNQEIPGSRYSASEFPNHEVDLLPLSSKAHTKKALYLFKYTHVTSKPGGAKTWEGKPEMNIALK